MRGDGASANEALSRFQEKLIGGTLRNAASTPYYRNLWENREPGTSLEDLRQLPFAQRFDITAAGHDAQVRDGERCQETFTGGTSGDLFPFIVGKREQVVGKQFYREVHSAAFARPLTRAIRFADTATAWERPLPVPIRFHFASIYGNGTFQYCREQVLSRTHHEVGVEDDCTLMVAGERIIRAFTEDTARLHPDGFENPLKFIFSYSVLLTARSRKRIEEVWNARVIDRYGLSEVIGGSIEHPVCGWYHFEPVSIPEVIGARSKQPLKEGVGIVVLTGLMPFQQAQPMVRYWTNDIVEVTHSRSAIPGRLAIRPLGRTSLALQAPEGDGWWLVPRVLIEAMEVYPEIAKKPFFLDAIQVKNPYDFGEPIYKIEKKQVGRTTEVTLRIMTKASGADFARLTDELGATILSQSPEFRAACSDGSASLRFAAIE